MLKRRKQNNFLTGFSFGNLINYGIYDPYKSPLKKQRQRETSYLIHRKREAG